MHHKTQRPLGESPYIPPIQKNLNDTWPKNKISFCTSEFNIKRNSDYKPGGTTMFTLNSVSFVVLQKGQDSSGMGSWIYLIILGKDNRRTKLFTMYRPCKGSIIPMEDSTVIKQQWLVMQKEQEISST